MDTITLCISTGFPQDVLDVIRNEEKVCNYIDIPLQHIADNVLKSMRRGTTFKRRIHFERFSKSSGMAIRTSLIVGYRIETEKDFEILRIGCVTLNLIDWVFTYSHEENTSAYDLEDDVPASESCKSRRDYGDSARGIYAFECEGVKNLKFLLIVRRKFLLVVQNSILEM